MPGKKAHKPRDVKIDARSGPGRKSGAQTEGQYSRDIKRRKGQYTAAGDHP